MGIGAEVTTWVAFFAGVLSFLSPCVLPLVPAYLTYISGLSFAELKEEQTSPAGRIHVFWHALLFVAGFSLIFIALGALTGLASASVNFYLRDALGVIQKVGGVLIFLFGIHLSGTYRFGFLLRQKQIRLRHKPTGLVGTFLIGIVFASGWTPCVGPILGAILAVVAGSEGSVKQGTILLSVYSAGLGVPFLVSALAFHRLVGVFDQLKKHLHRLELVTGLLLMLTGILLFFDLFSEITWYLFELLPEGLG